MTDHHRFLLKEILDDLRRVETKISKVEGEIEKRLEACQEVRGSTVHDPGSRSGDGVSLSLSRPEGWVFVGVSAQSRKMPRGQQELL